MCPPLTPQALLQTLPGALQSCQGPLVLCSVEFKLFSSSGHRKEQKRTLHYPVALQERTEWIPCVPQACTRFNQQPAFWGAHTQTTTPINPARRLKDRVEGRGYLT